MEFTQFVCNVLLRLSHFQHLFYSIDNIYGNVNHSELAQLE